MNRPALFGVLIASLSVSAFAQPSGAQWPMAHFDRFGSGAQPVGPNSSELISPWRFSQLGSGGFSGGIFLHGLSMGADGFGYCGQLQSGNIHRVNLATGSVVATTDLDDFSDSMPAIGAGDHIYVHMPDAGGWGPGPGRLFALDKNTLETEWFVTTGLEWTDDYIYAHPIIASNGDIIQAGSTLSGSGKVFRINSSGQIIWERNFTQKILNTPAITRDDALILITVGDRVEALDPLTGVSVWATVSTSAKMTGVGVAPDGTIVANNLNGKTYGISPANGFTLWSHQAVQGLRGAPAFFGNTVYVGSDDRRLYSLNVVTGARNWSYGMTNRVQTHPVVGPDGYIYTYDYSGVVAKITPLGQPVWEFTIGAEGRGMMTLGQDATLYIGSGDNNWRMLMIKQTPAIGNAFSANTIPGTYVSGSVTSTRLSDDQYYVGRVGSTTRDEAPFLGITLIGKAPTTNVHWLKFKAEVSCSLANEVPQEIYLFNYAQNKYDRYDARIAPISDTEIEITVSINPNRYINQSNRDVNALLIWGSNLVDLEEWSCYVDVARWSFSPVLQL